jgi:phenylalanyl-tRNA synthetase alpha subunit
MGWHGASDITEDVGIDRNYQGFAFGMGNLKRLAMVRYGVS